MSVDPALVAIWAQGWAKSRGVAPPVRDCGALRIEVGLPDQVRRYVFPDPPRGIAEVAAKIDAPHILLKAPEIEATVRAILPSRFAVERTGTFMPLGTLPSDPPPIPPAYHLTKTGHDHVVIVELRDDRDTLAARGHLALVGDWAIHDRIVTEEPHRRRGLGTIVMTTLGALARRRGARGGVLVATDAGAALYARLGWQASSPYVTAQLPAPLGRAGED